MDILITFLCLSPFLLMLLYAFVHVASAVMQVTQKPIRGDAVTVAGFNNGYPAMFYLCAVCENQALAETKDARVVKCEKCGRLYGVKAEHFVVRVQ